MDRVTSLLGSRRPIDRSLLGSRVDRSLLGSRVEDDGAATRETAAAEKRTPPTRVPRCDDELLRAYACCWIVHQLAPFVDVALRAAGLYGQGLLDHRPVRAAGDWSVRLPLIIAAALLPRSTAALAVAHLANVAYWFSALPQAWDHECWAALVETAFARRPRGKSSRGRRLRRGSSGGGGAAATT